MSGNDDEPVEADSSSPERNEPEPNDPGPIAPEAEDGGPRWRMAALFVPAAVLVDQVTKQMADSELATRGIVPVVDGLFMLRYSRNRGAFFSLGENMPDGIRRAFFVIATIAAIGLITHLYRRARDTTLRWALLLLLGGAVGNLIDRVLYGEVIDFLHVHWGDAFHWATFNVADVYISAGLVLLLIDVFRSRPEADKKPSTEPDAEPEPEETP